MVFTYAANIHGEGRVYLGAHGSVTVYAHPTAEPDAWTITITDAVDPHRFTAQEKLTFIAYHLAKLADALNIPPDAIEKIPYEAIKALHTPSPQDNRRMPVPRRVHMETAYMATDPGVRRPLGDFQYREDVRRRRTR